MVIITFTVHDVFFLVFAVKKTALALVRVWFTKEAPHFETSKAHLEMLVRIEIISHLLERKHRLVRFLIVNLLFVVTVLLRLVTKLAVQDRNSLLVAALVKVEKLKENLLHSEVESW